MKALLIGFVAALSVFFAAGCMFPSLPKNIPGNAGWVVSNWTFSSPWVTTHADLIKSVENQQTNEPPLVLFKSASPVPVYTGPTYLTNSLAR